MIKKFRKKPVVVEAQKLSRNYFDVVLDWVGSSNYKLYNNGEFAEDECYIQIRTLEGVMEASEGDWIIKEPHPTSDRKFYPCKPDIFEKTYEEVKDEPKKK